MKDYFIKAKENNEKYNMTCSLCGPNIPCYEELYGKNPESPYLIRFIEQIKSVAVVIFELAINNNESDEENTDITYGSLKCAYCHNLVILNKVIVDQQNEVFHEA